MEELATSEDVLSDLKTATQNILQRILSEQGNTATVTPDYLEECLECEIAFISRVVTAYVNWSKLENPVVLWDVDDTLGKMIILGRDNMSWFVRPAISLLLPYLQKTYPTVRNGILTSRDNASATKGLEEFMYFFDTTFVYNVYDGEMADASILPVTLDSLDPPYDSNTLKKLHLLERLDKKISWCLIDDNAVAHLLGDRGVCVYDLMPRMTT